MRMETSVEVALDPAAAFVAFTDEIDHWWGNGPIDAWDFTRTTGRCIEPRVGGRVLEVHGDNDVLELGRITAWEPGACVAWASSVDDVAIDVRFTAVAAGTRVTVVGEVPDGGRADEGMAVVRMVPQWLPRHVERDRQAWPAVDRLALIVRSTRPNALASWLCEAFGFASTIDIGEPEPESSGVSAGDDQSWVELRLGTSMVVVQRAQAPGSGSQPGEAEPFVFVEDLGAHFDRASTVGAKIVEPIMTHGFSWYVAADCDGRRWTFAQAGARQRRPVR